MLSLFLKKKREIAMDLVSKPKNGYKMGPYQLIRRVVTPIIGVVIPVTHLMRPLIGVITLLTTGGGHFV